MRRTTIAAVGILLVAPAWAEEPLRQSTMLTVRAGAGSVGLPFLPVWKTSMDVGVSAARRVTKQDWVGLSVSYQRVPDVTYEDAPGSTVDGGLTSIHGIWKKVSRENHSVQPYATVGAGVLRWSGRPNDAAYWASLGAAGGVQWHLRRAGVTFVEVGLRYGVPDGVPHWSVSLGLGRGL